MPLGQRFDAQKAIEVVLFIANRVDEPTLHRIFKLLYFADLKQLKDYGKLIVADSYVAMKHGPVPSCTYDLLKAIRDDLPHTSRKKAKDAFDVVDRMNVKPKRAADTDFLSAADVDSLTHSIGSYGKCSFSKLSDMSHDRAWKEAGADELMSLVEVARVAAGDELADYIKSTMTMPADSDREPPRSGRGGFLRSLARS